MKVRLKVARRYLHSVHLRRDAEQAGHEVTRFLWADEVGENMCARGAAGVTAGCQGIATLPDTAHRHGYVACMHSYGRRIAWSPIR